MVILSNKGAMLIKKNKQKHCFDFIINKFSILIVYMAYIIFYKMKQT